LESRDSGRKRSLFFTLLVHIPNVMQRLRPLPATAGNQILLAKLSPGQHAGSVGTLIIKGSVLYVVRVKNVSDWAYTHL